MNRAKDRQHWGVTSAMFYRRSPAKLRNRRVASVLSLALLGVSLAACLGDSSTRKPEYVAAQADLGSDRIEDLTVPGDASTNLDDTDGKYGYYLRVMPDQAVTMTVLGIGTYVTYFPEYSPGYDFMDTTPGTTIITNLDPDNSNGILLVLEGSSDAQVTVVEGG